MQHVLRHFHLFHIPHVLRYFHLFNIPLVEKIGTVNYENGDCYHGELKEGSYNREGRGKMTFRSSKKVFLGQFKNDQAHGPGNFFFLDGHSLHGHFVEGKMEGYGLKRFQLKKIYDGEWEKGRIVPGNGSRGKVFSAV